MSITEKPDAGITRDLMVKIAADVGAAVLRSAALAPPPVLPVLVSGAAAAFGMVAAELDRLAGCLDKAKGPGHDNLLLAGLLIARTGMSADGNSISEAYKDYAVLKAAGREPVTPTTGSAGE